LDLINTSQSNQNLTFQTIIDKNYFEEIVTQSEQLSEKTYSQLWDKLTQEFKGLISWGNFLPQFCTFFKIYYPADSDKKLEFQCLKSILECKENISIITVDAFERLIKCVGPFIDGAESLDRVVALLNEPWFMGNMTPQNADSLLRNLTQIRSFLVRFSGKSGEFSITWRVKEKVMHTRVPPIDKYNLRGYVEFELKKKKFEEYPTSPFKDIFAQNYVKLHNYKFIL